jgi:hypothetical protein
LNECKRLKVKVNKPKSIESFLDALTAVKDSKRKAANLLFEEIEHDVADKEKFVLEQTEKLREMNESFYTMLDYEKVLQNVKVILPRIQGGGFNKMNAVGGAVEIDEEVKSNSNHVSINGAHSMEREPLLLDGDNVMIANIAGTIEVDEKPRLKKLLFRATRGKALTFF